jgi:hypothetical protein
MNVFWKGRTKNYYFFPVTVVEAVMVPKGSVFNKMNPLTIKVLIKNLVKISLCTISLHSNIGLFL